MSLEVGGLDRVVTSHIFWELGCQNGGVLVWFGLRRLDFVRGRDKRLCVWVILGNGGVIL